MINMIKWAAIIFITFFGTCALIASCMYNVGAALDEKERNDGQGR